MYLRSVADVLTSLPREHKSFADCLQVSRFIRSEYNLAAWTRRVSGKPSITVGSIGMTGEHIDTLMGDGSNAASPDRLLELFDRGDFDLIAVGRGMLVNPGWANKVRDGRIDLLDNRDPEVLKALIWRQRRVRFVTGYRTSHSSHSASVKPSGLWPLPPAKGEDADQGHGNRLRPARPSARCFEDIAQPLREYPDP